ncbi:hypothetical protein MML48_1g03783 [Holotrichia oblita]|uniref:Uncharacterized protein n=1 Tax=Holotrichia oblita TaxID=644536 RepID=A0ACB9TVZ8_HOLOL|nr:hypothetical protein MML48_1g03783 [Holotrichia oblita]
MRAFVLFAAIITLVQGRPGGYVYSPTIPSGIINTYDTFGSSAVYNGASLGTVSVNSIGNSHEITNVPLNGGIGLTSAGGVSSSADFSSGSFTPGNAFSSGGSFQHGSSSFSAGGVSSNADISGGLFTPGNAFSSGGSFQHGSSSFSANDGSLEGGSSGGTGIGSSDVDVKSGIFGGGPGTLVQKHIYVHVPPLEHEELHARRPIPIAPVRKHYKIIFIKAPTPPTPTAPVIPLQSQVEEKTIVYVLIKRPDDQPDVHVPVPAPTQPTKPEVYFIRYKAQKDVSGAGSGVVVNGDADNSGIEQKIISSSVSSSSHSQSSKTSSSSSISSSYGPPSPNNGY